MTDSRATHTTSRRHVGAVRVPLAVVLSSVLAIAGLVAGPVAPASAATDPTTFAELQTAFHAGGTVRLGADISGGRLVVPEGVNVTLELMGHHLTADSTGVSDQFRAAGISVQQGATFTVDTGAVSPADPSAGVLTATAGGDNAAIGGELFQQAGTINIKGGTVNAHAGGSGAAIGSANQGRFAAITISGGTVNATTSGTGASIGAGSSNHYSGGSGPITISGGTVTATTSTHPADGYGAAGVGGGLGSSVGDITITGGTVTAQGGRHAAGIGGGPNTPELPRQGVGAISIRGGTVVATAGPRAAGIGSGWNTSTGPLEVSGGVVTATGGASETYPPSDFRGGAGIGGAAGGYGPIRVAVTAGVVTARGGGGGAGIGSGGADESAFNGKDTGAVVSVSGNAVITAAGGVGAAGLGGGADNHGIGPITVGAGATVTASTGSPADVSAVGGGANYGGFPAVSNAGILIIAPDNTLRVPSGSAVTNTGTIRGAVSGDVTVNNYLLTFDPRGGSPTPAAFRVYAPTLAAAQVGVPAAPTRSGNSFGGWKPSTAGTGASLTIATTLSTGTWYAQWSNVTLYPVTFNSNGSPDVIAEQGVESGQRVTRPADPSRIGYAFAGWFAAGASSAWNFATPVTGPVVLTARWTVSTYTVSFNANGGTGGSSATIEHGAAATEPAAVPTRAGHTFQGWFDAASGGSRWNFSTPITGATVLYAQWAPNTYTVTFNANGGTGGSSAVVAHGGTATEPAVAPTYTGRAFAGWFDAATGGSRWNFATPITGARTLYAQWTLNSYTVAFDSNGGSDVDSQRIAHGQKASRPTTPSRAGHTFAGWFADNADTAWNFDTLVTGPVALTAQWTLNSYTVTFNANGGTGGDLAIVAHGSAVFEPTVAPTYTGRTFQGWFDAASGGSRWNFATPITGSTSLYAHWTVNQYEVTFDANGGTSASSATVAHGSAVAEPPVAPTYTGRTFQGWFDAASGGSRWNFATPITGATTLYAYWTLINYTVAFDANGGTGASSATVAHGSAVAEPTVAPAYTGRSFQGWFDAASGGSLWSFSTPITDATTLYAHWTLNQYAVTFDSNGGSDIDAQLVGHNLTVSRPADDPSRVGHTFSGWFAEDAAFEWDFTTAITGPVELTAHWTVNSYTVTFDANGGTGGSSATVAHGDLAAVPTAEPTFTGRTFQGWFDAAGGGSPWNPATPITGATTVYAGWTLNSYTVSFDSNGGSAVDAQRVDHGAGPRRPDDPERVGHAFRGWFTAVSGGTAWGFSTPITDATTLYARWAENTSMRVSVGPDAAAVVVGTSVTVTGSVSPAGASGSIEVFDGAASLGRGTLSGGEFRLAAGTFSAGTSTLGAGLHSFTAVFTPDDDRFAASTSDAVILRVNAQLPQGSAPAADTDDLLVKAEANDWPVVPGTGNPLPWTEPTDSFVDAFVYSTPIALGVLPVVDGVIRQDTLVLPRLAPGLHHLVFVGQTTGRVTVVAFTVAKPGGETPGGETPGGETPGGGSTPVGTPGDRGVTGSESGGALAATGADSTPWLMLGGTLLLAGVWLMRRRIRNRAA